MKEEEGMKLEIGKARGDFGVNERLDRHGHCIEIKFMGSEKLVQYAKYVRMKQEVRKVWTERYNRKRYYTINY